MGKREMKPKGQSWVEMAEWPIFCAESSNPLLLARGGVDILLSVVAVQKIDGGEGRVVTGDSIVSLSVFKVI